MKKLAKEGIETRNFFWPLHQQPMGRRSQWQVGTITLNLMNEYFMKIIKRRQFATVDPATEEVITMVAEADRLASRSFSCLLEYTGCSHNLSDVRTTIFTNNGTSSSTIFENLLREIRKKKKSIKSLQMHACIFSRADVDLAVGAARAAFKPGSAWRKMDASGRGQS